ncbi:MAG TPA: hypothetical protein DGG95_16755 [Cytophagales bacterium]|jgi:starch-binding outer membrane protein SusE/F|nr:hypothetical protein [Cytophagales bacterium]
MRRIQILNDMKYMKSYLYTLIAGLLLFSCSNDDTKITYTGGSAPVLGVSSTSDLVLSKSNQDFSSLQFQWTNPGYSFSNGASTQDVYYTLQIDTMPATGTPTFTNPKLASLPFTNDLTHIFTVRELNTALSNLELTDYVPHDFAFRVKATLVNSLEPQYSNVIHVKISTYLDVVYPVPAHLYIVGDATPSGWSNDSSHPDATQTFTKVNAYTFVLNSLALTNKQFLFIPVAGDWTHKYAYDAPGSTNNTSGDYFKPDANSNFQAPASGNYKITVNFKTGKYSMEKLN